MGRHYLLRQGKILEYITLSWNILGVIVLTIAVPAAQSVALIAFGFDSLLEIGASTIVIWELNGTGGNRQGKGLRLMSIAFFILGFYIFLQSIYNLINHKHPGQSNLGVIWLTLTCIAMLFLALKKYQVGKQLNNQVLLIEGRVTFVDAALAALVLISMLLNRWLGWWVADIVGALILAQYCFWEAIHIMKELQQDSILES